MQMQYYCWISVNGFAAIKSAPKWEVAGMSWHVNALMLGCMNLDYFSHIKIGLLSSSALKP